ncbi:hypothetical protein TSAR_013818, partial [Trichomalopsis sarcophagae]
MRCRRATRQLAIRYYFRSRDGERDARSTTRSTAEFGKITGFSTVLSLSPFLVFFFFF